MNARSDRRRMGIIGAILAGIVGLSIAGCGDDPAGPDGGGDTTRPPSGLILLVPAAGAPALVTSDTSFIATKGVRSEVRLSYENGDQFLELDIQDGSLLRYPINHPKAGALFADGDTVTISIAIDPATLSATLLPSGLQFDPLNPAELELRYLNADPDLDGDGDEDPELEDDIDLWRQENPGDLWERVGTLQDFSLDRVRAELTQFSRYALGI